MITTLKKHTEALAELHASQTLATSASSSSTCAVSHQGLEDNSSSENLHSGSTSPTPRIRLAEDRSS